MNRQHVVIISGGTVEENLALDILKKQSSAFLIAVDRGLEFFYKHKIKPDYIVGDLTVLHLRLSSGTRSGQRFLSGSLIRSRMRQIQRLPCDMQWRVDTEISRFSEEPERGWIM